MADTCNLIVISGPSGVGKSTIARGVLDRTDARFSVSVTTRKPRPGEADGREYFFVDRPAFEKMIEAGELLEWAEVFGRLYGTPAGPVNKALAEGQIIILDIDVQGGMQVHEKMPQATFVLVTPPSSEELARRLTGRGSEDEKTLAGRLAAADAEIDVAKKSGIYNHVIVNDDLEEAIRQGVEIVRHATGQTDQPGQ